MMEVSEAVKRGFVKLEGATQSLAVGHGWDIKQHSL